MKKLLIVAAISFSASAAYAADAVVYEPPVVVAAPVFIWTGGYVGLQAGYAWGDSHVTYQNGDYADPDPDGWLGGVYVGYNYQMPSNVVVGIEADIAYANIDGFGGGFDSGGIAAPPGYGNDVDVNWTGAVRARLGYAVDRFLPYIAGGVAFADVDFMDNDSPDFDTDGDTMVGWTIGAGVEYAFTDALIGRLEYRYTDFGSADLSYYDGFLAEADLTTSDVRFGLAWKF